MDELSDLDQATLDFEHAWTPKGPGAKQTAIREAFDETATRFYQRLNKIIDLPEALAYDPLLVKRLQRLRRAREVQRSAARLGFDDGVG